MDGWKAHLAKVDVQVVLLTRRLPSLVTSAFLLFAVVWWPARPAKAVLPVLNILRVDHQVGFCEVSVWKDGHRLVFAVQLGYGHLVFFYAQPGWHLLLVDMVLLQPSIQIENPSWKQSEDNISQPKYHLTCARLVWRQRCTSPCRCQRPCGRYVWCRAAWWSACRESPWPFWSRRGP